MVPGDDPDGPGLLHQAPAGGRGRRGARPGRRTGARGTSARGTGARGIRRPRRMPTSRSPRPINRSPRPINRSRSRPTSQRVRTPPMRGTTRPAHVPSAAPFSGTEPRRGLRSYCLWRRLIRDLHGGSTGDAIGKRAAAGERGHPDSGPAAAGVREFYAERTGAGAAGGLACHLGVAADAGDVRGGGAAAPAAGSVSGVPGAKRYVRRVVLGTVRVGRAGHGDLRAAGRVRALAGVASAAVCQGAGA